MKRTRICDIAGIEYPIIQAPMTWITSAELAAAVSNAGGLGTLGPNAGQTTVTDSIQETAERLRREIAKVRRLTDKPFAANLILTGEDIASPETFGGACFKVILEERVPVVITAGFTPDARIVKMIHDCGMVIFHREPNINARSAVAAEANGIDAVIAVGFDGGGHLSAFRIPTFTLIPLIKEAVSIPVIAGGGIVNRKGMAAAMELGADAVYMGTRFIVSDECPAHPRCKQLILDAGDDITDIYEDSLGLLVRITRKENVGMIELKSESEEEVSDAALITNTGGIKEGMLEGDTGNGSVSISIASSLIKKTGTVQEIIQDLIA